MIPFPRPYKNVLIASHCTSGTRLDGFDKPPVPYILRNHSESALGVSTQVLWPEGQPATLVRFTSPQRDDHRHRQRGQQCRHAAGRRMPHLGGDADGQHRRLPRRERVPSGGQCSGTIGGSWRGSASSTASSTSTRRSSRPLPRETRHENHPHDAIGEDGMNGMHGERY